MAHPLCKALEQEPAQPARDGAWRAEADAAESNGLGLRARALRLHRDSPSVQSPQQLGGALAERARYLLEPLAVVESDAERALLRSSAPAPNDEGQDYYELWVERDALSLERFRGQPSAPRHARPVDLTWEQAERLLRDVAQLYEAE